MKRALAFGSLVFVTIAAPVLAAAWLSWRSELRRLRLPGSITKETGLRLPSQAHITATRAHIFSLADGNNYEWLIEADSSLSSWANTNMSVERGGWEHIRLMSELGFSEEMPKEARFGSVWQARRRTTDGREETTYLYLSEDGRVGILTTFRP